jgi:NTP pyrophosphatase (non-canonical NTP hydrolase)
MTVKQLQDKCFGHALTHGFIRKNMDVPKLLDEVHGEVDEALSAIRIGRRADYKKYCDEGKGNEAFVKYVKDSLEDELADTVMRVATICGYLGIDLQKHIAEKLAFNKNRGYLHGKTDKSSLS